MEQWIAQKRAELAREKADLSNKENEPTATIEPTGQPEPVKTEPLLFKLGDDYQIRKAKFNEELKAWDILVFTYIVTFKLSILGLRVNEVNFGLNFEMG